MDHNSLYRASYPQLQAEISKAIRVTIVQPSLAKYRVPVFRELARRPGIELHVVFGSLKGLANVDPEGFQATPSVRRCIPGVGMVFNRAEWKYASRRHSDVIVLQWTPRSLSLLPALARAAASGVPRVLWGHGYAKDVRGRRRYVREWLARCSTAIAFYDPKTRDEYVSDGWNPDSLFVALNSLDHTEIDQARQFWLSRPEELESFRREQKIQGRPVILFLSRLQPNNRVDLLIRATAKLVPLIPSLKTVIIGNGTEEKARLESLARETDISDNVLFLKGIYDERKLAPWMLSASVFCYPENIGLSLIHAFWYGLPVVTSNNPGVQNPEVVALRDGVNGLTYRHGSVDSLSETLLKVLANDDLRASMSAAARRSVEENHTIPQMVDGLEAAIRYAFAKSFVHR